MKKELQVTELHKEFDALQNIYGSPLLDSIYGAGDIKNPKVCFIFMNPTGRNVASDKNWDGIKSLWLGTKNIWKLFDALGLISPDTYKSIKEQKPKDWTPAFSRSLYEDVASHHVYMTNLGKCTQVDAKPLPNKVFKEYLPLLEKEIALVKPKILITFGNQVSSCILNQNVSVSTCRKQFYEKEIEGHTYKVYPVYYPVGQGMRNIDMAIQDIKEIMEENNV
ncbi:MAG: uracil-DNA glycosylase family protein [Bacilli bacterium]|nr:uracil-DNA glycosylase family protein [Bacilli bacterium]